MNFDSVSLAGARIVTVRCIFLNRYLSGGKLLIKDLGKMFSRERAAGKTKVKYGFYFWLKKKLDSFYNFLEQ